MDKISIFKEIYMLHHRARTDKPDDIEDYNVNNPTAKRYRLLLRAWWTLPDGLTFIPYKINKGHTFGAPSQVSLWKISARAQQRG